MKIICTKLYEENDDNPMNVFFSLTPGLHSLSEGEYLEISTLTLDGEQEKEIMQHLDIEEEDVENYISEIYTYFVDKGVDVELDTIAFTPNKEDVERENKLDSLLYDLQKHFGGKYSDIPVKNRFGNVNLKLRIADHTHNWGNNEGAYFISVVVSDNDATESIFIDSGMDRSLRIDSGYSLLEGIKEINDAIDDYLFDKGIEKIEENE